MTKIQNFLKGLIKENPVLVLILGTCPTLATTTSILNALGMGVAATVVLVCSNMAISALRNVIPDKVRIPCYIVLIAGFVTAVELLLHAFVPSLYDSLILGRAEMYASKNGVIDSAIDGLGMGCGFILALFAMSFIREVFGAGSFCGIEIPGLSKYCIPILAKTPGGFLVFGCLIAAVNAISRGKAIKKKEFGCAGCPSAATCGRLSCTDETQTGEEAAK